MTRQIKIVVEQQADSFVAYPLGLKATIVGQGATYDEALADVNAAFASTLRLLAPKLRFPRNDR